MLPCITVSVLLYKPPLFHYFFWSSYFLSFSSICKRVENTQYLVRLNGSKNDAPLQPPLQTLISVRAETTMTTYKHEKWVFSTFRFSFPGKMRAHPLPSAISKVLASLIATVANNFICLPENKRSSFSNFEMLLRIILKA